MNRDRLERLAVLLDNYRDDGVQPAFDLEKWGTFEVQRGGFLWLQKHPCDTAACAVGMGCLSGEFKGDGLSFLRLGSGEIQPLYHRFEGWEAVCAFFDLTDLQATRLFDEDEYGGHIAGEAGARRVARRIRALIKPRKRKPKLPKQLTALLDNKNHTPLPEQQPNRQKVSHDLCGNE